MINLDCWFFPKTSQFLSSECSVELAEGWGVFLVYLCVSEVCVSPFHIYQLFVLSLSTLTFGCRFFTVRFPPLKSRQQRLLDALCLFVARTSSYYNSSYRRRETVMMCTFLWYVLQGQVGQLRVQYRPTLKKFTNHVQEICLVLENYIVFLELYVVWGFRWGQEIWMV